MKIMPNTDADGENGEMVGREAACHQPVTDCHGLNAAAMREALEQIHELLSIGWKPDTAMCIRYEAAYQIAKEALAAPPRNCDVGNEKDQSDRLDAFCAKHFQYGDDSPCSQCPVAEGKDQSLPCVFRFLQLPYEKKAK